jgi:serine/threonine-protein kinase RsbW
VLRLDLPAEADSLERVNGLVRALAREAGLPPEREYQLRLATEELFTNIVRHGYGPAAAGCRVGVEGDVTDDRVWVRLIDRAAPFDPVRAPDPVGLDKPLEDREPGALGLYLVRHVADAASYEYVDGTNRTTVAVWRRGRSADGQVRRVRDDADRQRR